MVCDFLTTSISLVPSITRYAPCALRSAEHLLSLQLPCLCVLQQRWAQQLPVQGRKKKLGGENDGDTKGHSFSVLRSAMREASAKVATALTELQQSFGKPEPLAFALLQEEEMKEHLGSSAHAMQAHEQLLSELCVAGETAMVALVDAIKRSISALHQTAKQL